MFKDSTTRLSGCWGGDLLWGHHSSNFPRGGAEETEAGFPQFDVPKADWKKRAMSRRDKPQLFVCALLESHANEKKLPGKIP